MAYAAMAQMGLQLASGYFKAQNMRRAGKLNSKIAEWNAEYAELDAYDAIVGGQTKKARYQSVVDQTLSTQTANIAAADVDINYGSIADVQAETRFTAELNKMEFDKQAQEQALGYRQQARSYRTQGSLQRMKTDSAAADAQFAGIAGAANTYASGYKEINADVAKMFK